MILTLRSAVVVLAVAFLSVSTHGAPPQFHAPETQEDVDFAPRAQPWVEPPALKLPSAAELTTTTIKGRTYDIRKPAPRPNDATPASEPDAAAAPRAEGAGSSWQAIAFHEDLSRSLYFRGSGRGGRESKERLLIEDCTFIIDFEEGSFEAFDPGQSAVFVEGYQEVLVRNCVFFSKATGRDPLRKVIGSLIAYDCVSLQVEDCYFEGRTAGWRGHLLAFGCGPTSIRHCEINGRGSAAGGIWVATGVGEGKIGWPHPEQPELMIYPPGPLRIEGCWVHDQTGKENSDGIYVQSVRPYLLRDCKVERWGEDSLIDLGFRDTAPNKYDGRTLVNHGGIGVVEHCEFSGGWLKTSVGLGGGLIFRHNVLRGSAWLFPYVFDGGSWYVLGNEWDHLSSVVASGRNGQTDGWAPREGMLTNGAKMLLFNNRIASTPGTRLKALYVAGSQPPLKECVIADYNHYALDPPDAWALEKDGRYATLEAWRAATGNDVHSILGAGSRDQFKSAPADTVKLPGGLTMQWGEVKAGVTGSVGVQNPGLVTRAKALSEAFAADFAQKNFTLEAEALPVVEKTLETVTEKRSWASGGAYLSFKPKADGERITLLVKRENAGRYFVESKSTGIKGGVRFQLAVNGQALGGPVDFSKRGLLAHGIVALPAGEHRFTYAALAAGRGELDAIEFRDAASVEEEAARLAGEKAAAAARQAEAARRDAGAVKFAFAELAVSGKPRGQIAAYPGKGGSKYLLWSARGPGDLLAFVVDMPQAGRFAVRATTSAQADKGQLALALDGAEIGTAALSGAMNLGNAELTAGRHIFTLKLAASATGKETKVRLLRLELLPNGR